MLKALCISCHVRKLGLTNVTIITADMNVFESQEKYDRVVSIEMFEVSFIIRKCINTIYVTQERQVITNRPS